jgi:hypothetical protein
VEPDSILFSGPVSMVEQLPDIFNLTLSETSIQRNYDRELSMDLFSSSMIRKTPEVIRVRFEVEEFIFREGIARIELVNFPYDSSVYPAVSEVGVNYMIRKDHMDRDAPLDFLVIADLNNANAGDSTIVLEVIKSTTLETSEDLTYIRDLHLDQKKVELIYAQ